VTNVTNFGAFVDLGVHQDGLVHISELSHNYVQDARQAVKVGDIVKVKVIGVDAGMKRISLSMKAVMPKPQRRPRVKKKPKIAAATLQAGPGKAASAGPNAEPIPRQEQPRRSRPPRQDNRPKEQKQQQTRPPRPPVEAVPPPPRQTMEEKIRLLQEKFGRAR